MSLERGARLGAYEILEPAGAGGMGEVYKARDTRLDRVVAVKVLGSDSAGLRERFEREARAVSALNHPNVCVLHDIGREGDVDFLVMEHLDGETLAERLNRGPMPVDDAVAVARQIADALDAAHRVGVVHRDLKPANVMLTKTGAKLLDFGLARLRQGFDETSAEDSAPTVERDMTTEGAILGTFHYMSPEQAMGRDIDQRSDVFSFGTVLYEMLTGRRPFDGNTPAGVLAAIEKDEPTLSDLPKPLGAVLSACLAKDPDERWQSASDALRSLRFEEPARRSPPSRWAAIAAIGFALLSVAMGAALLRRPATENSTKRLTVDLSTFDRLIDASVALSPDGSGIVYAGERSGDRHVYYRRWDATEDEAISGTEGAYSPFFSPDGSWVAFFADDQLKKVRLSGGPATVVCDAPSAGADGMSGTWGPDDAIIFATMASPLRRAPAAGGPSEVLTTLDDAYDHLAPSLLPNGKTLLFTIAVDTRVFHVALYDFESGKTRTLVRGRDARYVPTGHLVYAGESDGTLYASPFDLASKQVTGDPVPVLTGVQQYAVGDTEYDVGPDGTLIYVPSQRTSSRLVWVDRDGRRTPLTWEPADYRYPRLSPDGTRIAVSIDSGDSGLDVWTLDLARGTRTRLTSGGRNTYPLWTPDGERVVFGGPDRLFAAPADGSDTPELLFQQAVGVRALSFTPDGRMLAYALEADLFARELGGESISIRSSGARELGATFSPDGKWVAYASDESGRSEVYVEPFPKSTGRWTISTKGGQAPLWSPTLSELYYRNENRVLVVPFEAGDGFRAGAPRVLFEGSYGPPSTGGNPYYDVTRDGQKFLMLTNEAGSKLAVVLHWLDELERTVPTD